ncbi:MAG: hypothetical protein ACR2QS_04590 [Woeseiaceae bacterium]
MSLLVLLSACGGQASKENPRITEVVEPTDSGNYFAGAEPIYADLFNNKDGSWTFRTITTSDEPSDTGYLVRLNDLTAAFDTRIAECTTQVYPDSHRCSPLNPFRDEDSGVWDKIINSTVAVGTGGKVTDITYSYETTFDETAFNKAVDEALINTDLNHRQLIALLSTYDAEVSNARLTIQNANERAQTARTTPNQLQVEVLPRIGGLTEYYEGDIDFTQLVDVQEADSVTESTAELATPDVLPCAARSCASKVNTALADLRANLQSNLQAIDASLQPTDKTYNVRCDMLSYAGYLLQAVCPEQLVATDGQPVQLPLDVSILSRDFDNLYPAMEVADEKLRVSIDGKEVTFFNATSEYLTLSAQTVYYNSTVHTTALPIDIPPGIAMTYELSEFASQAIGIESRYLQMTPDKAKRATFNFGFAVRYQLASESAEQTLHSMDTYNVDCAIRNRIQLGSCQPESLADAGSSKKDRKPRTPM